MNAQPVKPTAPGPVMCVDTLCKPSRPDPRIARIAPDVPPRAVRVAGYHAWIVRMTYWGGVERRFAWGSHPRPEEMGPPPGSPSFLPAVPR